MFFNIQDMNYEIIINNYNILRNERLIFFDNKQNLKYINKSNCKKLFLDITFKIISY